MNPAPLIPRKVLFGNPDRASVKLSPDGGRIAYLAPEEGVLNVWVAPRDLTGEAIAVTHERGRGIGFYAWAYTNRHVIIGLDNGGDENWRLETVDLTSGARTPLTPLEGVQAQIVLMSPYLPTEIAVGLNDRAPEWHDLYRIDILTGKRTLLAINDRFSQFVVDDRYEVRLALAPTGDGGSEILRLNDSAEWMPWDVVPSDDSITTQIVGLSEGGDSIYMIDSRGRNTSAAILVNLDHMGKLLLAQDPKCDISELIIHPTRKHIQAVAFTYERKRWQVIDNDIDADLRALGALADGEISVVSRSLDDRYWIVALQAADYPTRYYLHERKLRAQSLATSDAREPIRLLFSDNKALEEASLLAMHSAVIASRDGLPLVVYYTLPIDAGEWAPGKTDRAVPMVILPHGGPWGRDHWGFNPYHQWLANRGYAALSVNFRASTGFGKEFVNAGDREWGGKIMEDQVDAVHWAIESGIADPARIGIFGGSFGGYSALAGLAFTPDLYACAVDLVGPSNLITLLESMPPFWKPMVELLTRRIGDHRTPDGRALLTAHSPLTHVENIRKPLLIGQGANDPRVKKAESDQIAEAMTARNIPVTYVLYPDEGHGFARPQNRRSFNAITEAFMAEHLSGRCEPAGEDFDGSSQEILAGADTIVGFLRGAAEGSQLA